MEARLEDAGDDFWDAALAALDSDLDGVPNGEELQDPDGLWRPDDDASGDLDQVTPPGFPPGETRFL